MNAYWYALGQITLTELSRKREILSLLVVFLAPLMFMALFSWAASHSEKAAAHMPLARLIQQHRAPTPKIGEKWKAEAKGKLKGARLCARGELSPWLRELVVASGGKWVKAQCEATVVIEAGKAEITAESPLKAAWVFSILSSVQSKAIEEKKSAQVQRGPAVYYPAIGAAIAARLEKAEKDSISGKDIEQFRVAGMAFILGYVLLMVGSISSLMAAVETDVARSQGALEPYVLCPFPMWTLLGARAVAQALRLGLGMGLMAAACLWLAGFSSWSTAVAISLLMASVALAASALGTLQAVFFHHRYGRYMARAICSLIIAAGIPLLLSTVIPRFARREFLEAYGQGILSLSPLWGAAALAASMVLSALLLKLAEQRIGPRRGGLARV